MSKEVIIRRIGNSLGITLSEQIKELGLSEGDKLHIVRTSNGFELTPYDPDFAEALEDARRFMTKHANAMKALAK
ncbi:MAG: hypothetical protein RLO50_16505 [Azospirillaceae bacterium]